MTTYGAAGRLPDGATRLTGRREADEDLLNDTDALIAADPGMMLRAVASAGPQVRESLSRAADANLGELANEGRPRSVVVAGAGTAARAGDILATVAGARSLVPVISHRSPGVPSWVGAADVVLAVSASGRSPEAIAAAKAAVRRGARLVAVGAPDSELSSLAERARAPFVEVPRRAPARASLWALTVPVLCAASSLGLIRLPEADLAETATRLDNDAERCRPSADAFVNPAKALALDLAGSIPVIWGSSPLAAVAARRIADMLSSNARYPAVAGELGEANRGRVGLLDGVYGGLAEAGRDIFADPDDPESGSANGGSRLRVILLRDRGLADDEQPDQGEPVAVELRRADAVQELAARRGVRVTVIEAEGASAVERFASLVAIPDFASLYLALAHGFDPMAVPAINEMKELSTP
ncbi:MAG: SIS domain-containing protein [Micromonosporaceae bacterium]